VTLGALGVGPHPIRVQVTDEFGATSSASTTLTIYNNVPTAAFTTVPNPAACDQAVAFDASASSHGRPDRAIVKYDWDFGDGTTGAGVQVNHAFAAFGTFMATLTVTDNNVPARTATATMIVTVDQGNRAPIATHGGPYTVDLGAALTLDGSASTDPDAACGDSIAAWGWDIDNDGLFNDGSGPTVTLAAATVEILGLGVHPVALRVTDQFGLQNTALTTLTVIEPSVPPVANAGPDQSVARGMAATLDGSGSSDPDGNYPLTYEWTLVAAPGGSHALLIGAATATPSLTPDKPGNYVISLIVADTRGLMSAPDEVVVSTFNTAPVADAGLDQSITLAGTTVHLDGSASYDIEGDPFTYAWTLMSMPDGSTAALSDPTARQPTFIMDLYGEYLVRLVVTDSFGDASAADFVTITSNNVTPVADAGGNQAVNAGDTVVLDGGASHDANGDPLTYAWILVSKPADSTAELNPSSAVMTTFVADLPGDYIVSLVVSDGFATSTPSNVTVMAISLTTAASQTLREAISVVNVLPPAALMNGNLRNALTSKINAVLALIDQGAFADAVSKLQHDLLAKTDGCAAAGAPDRNDWIVDCDRQGEFAPLIARAIDLLRGL
jgi:PKD repeat protein